MPPRAALPMLETPPPTAAEPRVPARPSTSVEEYGTEAAVLPRFHVWTLGCQMNQSDSEEMAGALLAAGCEEAPSLEAAELIVAAARYMSMLKDRGAWLGFIGGVMGSFGAFVLSIDKTALCLVMSAFDTLPEAQFAQMLPGIEALFNFKGYLAILYLLPLLPIGFLILGIGLYLARAIPRWQSAAIIVAMLGLGVSAAVDIDLFGLIATVILAISVIPAGIQIIKGDLE